MAKDKKPPKKNKPAKAGDVEFFDQDEKLPDMAKPNSMQMSEDIKNHPKFDKFKKGNK